MSMKPLNPQTLQLLKMLHDPAFLQTLIFRVIVIVMPKVRTVLLPNGSHSHAAELISN
jgi:hypothetical protein